METKQNSTDARLRTRLLSKLNPENFRQMTSTMAAVLGFLLDTAFVRPSITAITVTTDGYLLADTDEPRFDCFLGDYKDLIRSWRCLLRVANLRIDEWMLAECLFASKIGYFDRTVA